jgi:hypothetical protein
LYKGNNCDKYNDFLNKKSKHQNEKAFQYVSVTIDDISRAFYLPLVVGAAPGGIQIMSSGEDKLRIRTHFNPFYGYTFPKPHPQISSRYKHQHHRNSQKLTHSLRNMQTFGSCAQKL